MAYCTIVPRFCSFTAFTPVIPEMYWNVRSAEQRYFALARMLDKLAAYSDGIAATQTEFDAELERLANEFEKFKESGFEDYYIEQIDGWIQENAATVFQLLAKQVFFGINDAGYFVAYIPDGWEDIEFDTILDYGSENYGRLVFKWAADGEND